MICELMLASANAHKAEEFFQLFSKEVVQIDPAPEKLNIDETGSTFGQNAFLKARTYCQKFQRATLADDSGLEVSALPTELGVRSARFGGAGLDDQARARLLLDKLKDKSDRSASFVCFLCLYFSPEEVFFFEGRLEGRVAPFCRGEHGFGYDPVFLPGDSTKTLAEMPDWKRKHSHRATAAKLAERFLRGWGFGDE